MVAGTAFESVALRYERSELPILYPAMKMVGPEGLEPPLNLVPNQAPLPLGDGPITIINIQKFFYFITNIRFSFFIVYGFPLYTMNIPTIC